MTRNPFFILLAITALCIAAAGHAAQQTGTALSADSVSIGYTVRGEGTPALAFVHCWCCDSDYWKNQVPHFAKRHTVVAIDLAGHGSSGLERNDWTLGAFASDVASVVKALDLEEVILVGHSMGGPVALEAARLLAGRVIGVVGIDTYQDFGRTIPEEQRAQFLAAFEADFPGVTRRFVRSMFPPGADSMLIEVIVEDMAAAPPAVGIGAMKNLLAYDPAPAAGEIEIPIYAINSEMFPTNVEGNKKLAKSFDVKFMPGVGHFVHLEDPERFNRLLEEVVREITERE